MVYSTGSFVPPAGFGMPSQNGQGAANTVQNPKAAVGSYVNQQLGGLFSGTSSATGGSTPGDQNLASPQGANGTGAATVGQPTVDLSSQISSGNDRLGMYADAAGTRLRAKRAAEAAAQAAALSAKNTSGPSNWPGLNNGGMTKPWTNSKGLSGDRNRALSLASSYLGTPYVLGGESHRGIDCSGLVQVVYKQLGFNVAVHGARWQGRNIPGVRTSFANLRPGDLVCWRDGSHIAIYAGGGQIIEAPNPARGVVRRPLWASQSAVFGIHLTFRGE
jgi:peptidoglycan DL-endopeptidase CwlO